MQVTAYQDPETKQLFLSAHELEAFQRARQRQRSAAAKRDAANKAALEAQNLLRNNLTGVDNFSALAEQMYRAALATRRLRKGRAIPEVIEVCFKNWYIRRVEHSERSQNALRVGMTVFVTISANPHNVFRGPFLDLCPYDVLKPFRLAGGGGGTMKDNGEYLFSGQIEANLSDLPLMQQRVADYAQVAQQRLLHNKAVAIQTEQALGQSLALEALRLEVSAAQEEVRKAQHDFAEALRRKKAMEANLTAQIEESNRFQAENEYQQLRDNLGLSASTHNAGLTYEERYLHEAMLALSSDCSN